MVLVGTALFPPSTGWVLRFGQRRSVSDRTLNLSNASRAALEMVIHVDLHWAPWNNANAR